MSKSSRVILSISFVLIFVLFAASAFATLPFRVGGTTGMSISNQSIDYNDASDIPGTSLEFDYTAGFAISVIAEYPASQYVTIRPQIQYVQKGFEDDYVITNLQGQNTGVGTFKQRINYLSIPVLAKVTPPVNSFVVPYALAGPRLDIKVSESSDFFSDDMLSDGAKSSVFGLSLGAGVQKTLKHGGTVLLEGLWELDLTDSMEMETLNSKNKSFVIQVGYLFK